MTRVLVVDDESLVRDGLVAIVSARPGLEVVGTADSGEGALEQVAALQPDVVLMDLRMPGIGGLEAMRRLATTGDQTRVLVLTTIETDEIVYDALRAGASGFLLKSVPREQLWLGIEAVAAGDALLAPRITRRLIEQHVARGAQGTSRDLVLTERQADVVKLVARGLSNREIADELFLAETTVKGYVSEVLAKHDLRDRTQLVVLAYESGLVRPGA
ncbi:MAG TPA: response regulator transcription factor [Nocardioidaceae bacterium]|nr:response regulator transcription factor [Nocardioidaceae bacterium]